MTNMIHGYDPFHLTAIGTIHETPASDLKVLFEQGKEAQKHWAALPFSTRKTYFYQLRDVIVRETRKIVETISRSTSKPYIEALSAEIWGTLETLRFCVDQGAGHLKPRKLWMGRYWAIFRQSVITQKPYGVIGIISPWNFPFAIPMQQLLPAIMAGNSVILKPSELTPLVGVLIQELFAKAEFPPHLLQIVFGGKAVGQALVQSGVQKVLFTGSTQVGTQVAAQAGALGIPTSLELGGKDAMVVCADAHLETASSGALWGGFANCGQICASVERLFVHEAIYSSFVEKLKRKRALLTVGPPEKICDVGTVISENQKLKVMEALNEATKAGLLCTPEFRPDKRLQPTLVENVSHDMPLAQKEIFGPVIPIIRYSSDDDAIQWINQNSYGLSASIWSRSISHAKRLAEQLDVGTVMINGSAYTHAFPMAPWGGIKGSGWGMKHGKWSFDEVTRTHHIHTNYNSGFAPEFWWFPYTQTMYEILVDLTVQFTRPGKFSWLLGLLPFFAAKRQKKY